MDDESEIRAANHKSYNYLELTHHAGKLLCPECAQPAGSDKGIVGLYGHLWRTHAIKANIIGVPKFKRKYHTRKVKPVAAPIETPSVAEDLAIALNARFKAILHPALKRHTSESFMDGLIAAYHMFREAFSPILPADSEVEQLLTPISKVTDSPNRHRHTCGIDGDPGAVTPLDGHCRACESGVK